MPVFQSRRLYADRLKHGEICLQDILPEGRAHCILTLALTKCFYGRNGIGDPRGGSKVIRICMEFTNGIKAVLSLALQANIGEKNIAVLDLRLRTLFIYSHAVAALDQITLSECSTYKCKVARSEKTLI